MHVGGFHAVPGCCRGLQGWTRVDFVVDSGASATTLPRKLLGESSKLSTAASDLPTAAWLPTRARLKPKLGCWELRASVAAISQPLLSVGQVTSRGNKVILGPKVCYWRQLRGRSTGSSSRTVSTSSRSGWTPATDFSSLLHTLSRGGAMLACKTAELWGSEPFRLEPHRANRPTGPLEGDEPNPLAGLEPCRGLQGAPGASRGLQGPSGVQGPRGPQKN